MLMGNGLVLKFGVTQRQYQDIWLGDDDSYDDDIELRISRFWELP